MTYVVSLLDNLCYAIRSDDSLARFSDHPQVVGIFEFVASDLLLVAGASSVWVFEGIKLLVRVKPTGDVRGTQAEHGAITEH